MQLACTHVPMQFCVQGPSQGQGGDSTGAGEGAGVKRGRDVDLDALLSRKTQRDRAGVDRYVFLSTA